MLEQSNDVAEVHSGAVVALNGMGGSLPVMSKTQVVAAMSLACLSTDGAAGLADLGVMSVHFIVVTSLEMAASAQDRKALTSAFARIGIHPVSTVHGGRGVCWVSDAAQQIWFSRLARLPAIWRSR
jgi:hypothetical protein